MAALASLLALNASASSSTTFEPGVQATYKDPSGRRWCVTVTAVSVGVDGVPWAWFTMNADPRRIGHVPVDELVSGCTS